MKLREVSVIKIAPAQLSPLLCLQLNYIYHIAPDDFVAIYDRKGQILYINNQIQEDDIEKFVRYVSFEEACINAPEDEGGLGELGDYFLSKYGDKAWYCLLDAYKARREAKEKTDAKEAAKTLLPLICSLEEDDDKANLYNEHIVSEVASAQNCGYKSVFWLGYLMGSAELKEGVS